VAPAKVGRLQQEALSSLHRVEVVAAVLREDNIEDGAQSLGWDRAWSSQWTANVLTVDDRGAQASSGPKHPPPRQMQALVNSSVPRIDELGHRSIGTTLDPPGVGPMNVETQPSETRHELGYSQLTHGLVDE
jgi:hypothetical protein